ncbi:Uma2 family endonuclease [Clostridium chromiireducens]|uniref:Uma2 family endonuclease n=1 Tax=Clostridium chromiireducens TaxID=225345 RepID=A0A399IQZ6_9CLOT|nr:Uma2 family endonuclease [Clostridium chromiireducens]RII33922.1 Uma2 family endonuclease [Clostridium chromiireducens]
MAINPIDNKIYTYNDYLKFADDEVFEIIDGRISAMSPAPSRIHQEIIMEIAYEIKNYIKSKNCPCKVYPAPFDVVLKNDDDDVVSSRNVVQPDISVICDRNKLTDKGCIGSPDMIVEVVSPYNPSNDYIRKLSLYEQFKVREYWIVNPMEKNILVYILTDKGYDSPKIYSFNDTVKVNIYDDLEIDFKSLSLL